MAKNIFIKYKKEIATYTVLFLIMTLLNGAKIMNKINPFGVAFLFSMVHLGKNGFVISLLYFLSKVLFDFSFQGIIIAVNHISVSILLFLIYKCLKKPINLIATIIALFFSQVGYAYFNISSVGEILATIVCIIAGLLFFYVCIISFGAVFFRGLQSRFTIDESICFSIFIIALASGLNRVSIWGFSLTNVIVALVVLLCSKTFTKMATIYLASLLGLGIAVSSGNITTMAIFVVYGIVCTAFSDKNKVVSSLCLLITDVVFGLFFNAYAYYDYVNIIAMSVVGIVFILLPQKILDKIKGYSYSYDANLTNEFIIMGQKELLKQKISKIAELFKQMQFSYRNLSVGEIDKENACSVLCEEIISSHCKECPKHNECLENQKIKEAIHQLLMFCLEKKKVTLLDANNLITTNCISLSSMIGEVNQAVNSYYEYEKKIKNEDANKMIIAEHLAGTSELFNELGRFIADGNIVNEKKSKLLLDELTINKVVVSETLVLEGQNGVETVLIVVRNSDVLSTGIMESLRSVFRLDFINVVRKMTRLSGWSILSFIPAPRYSLSVGVSGSAKEDGAFSGDTYSLTKISETKMLFAIADGMGHGKRANEISTVALSLVENFYRAGFSSKTIISSVNKILLPIGEENFTTLDVCVVDTSNGTADFIKIGASVSVIKSQNQSVMVSSDSLPLGIVGGVSPVGQKKVLKCGDVIVLASDGVVDAFDNFEDYVGYVNNENVISTQMLADNILEEVMFREKQHKDDKTVITIKLNQFSKTN